MKKFAIVAAALTLSQLSFANNNALATKITNKLHTQPTQTANFNAVDRLILMYGGKDIAKPRVASSTDPVQLSETPTV